MRELRARRSSTGAQLRSAWRWLAGASSAVVAVSVLAAAPAQAAIPASHLRSSVTPATVLIGGRVSVSGAVSPNVPGSPVILQKLVAGHWRTIAHRSTNTRGRFSFAVRTSGKPTVWSLRVERAGSSKAKAVVGKTLKVRLTRTAYKVTAVAVTKVNAGDPVVLTGRVSPKATGGVVLQVLRAGKWRTLATAKLSHSLYKISKVLPPKTYPLRVVKPFTSKIAQGASVTKKITVFPPPDAVSRPPVSPRLSLTSPDDATLALPGQRLVFSTLKQAATPAKSFTFTNSGNAAATVSGLAIQGADASSFSLAPGQPTTVVVPAGGSATVSVVFHPTANTDCPTAPGTPDQYRIASVNRNAALVYTTTDSGMPGGSAVLAGVNSCTDSGVNEPVLDQVLQALGYSDVVTAGSVDRRFIGPEGPIPGTDEVASPYFRAADPASPVSVIPLAHYSTADTRPYHATGWYTKGATLGSDFTCNAQCHQVFAFPAEATTMTYTQNQKLLPTPTGSSSFAPGAATFGLYVGEFTDVNFSDDRLNVAHDVHNVDIVPTQYLHDLRVYPAYGPGHVAIPNSYLVAVDVTRVPANKNNDYQDVVLLVRNVVPAS